MQFVKKSIEGIGSFTLERRATGSSTWGTSKDEVLEVMRVRRKMHLQKKISFFNHNLASFDNVLDNVFVPSELIDQVFPPGRV